MFRTAVASAGTSDVNELDASLSLENNPAVVNAHYEKVELQLKKSHYLQGTLPDGESDDLGPFIGLKGMKPMAGFSETIPNRLQWRHNSLRTCSSHISTALPTA